MSWFRKPQLLQPRVLEPKVTTLNENNQTSDLLALADARRLLVYLLRAAQNKNEIIHPSFCSYFYPRMDNAEITQWLNLVDTTQKEQAELRELTAKVGKILEKEYDMKPKTLPLPEGWVSASSVTGLGGPVTPFVRKKKKSAK